MKKITFSYSDRIANSNLTLIEFSEIISIIKNGKYKNQIESLRQLTSKEEKRKFKTENLPYFVSALFKDNYRKSENLTSGKYFIFDVDNIPTDLINELKEKFKSDSSILCHFLSPSGNGLKFIIELNAEITNAKSFSDVYIHYKQIYQSKYNITLDNTQDPTRACFISYDSDIYFNENNSPVSILLPIKPLNQDSTQNEKLTNKILKDIENMAKFLQGKITDYNDWVKLGFACASQGENGRKLFHILSINNNKYKDSESNIDKQFDECIKRYDEEKINLGYIIKFARNLGYSKRLENPIEVIEKYLSSKDIKRNIITRKIINSENTEIESLHINSMYAELKKQFIHFQFADFERIINSKFISDFNPLHNFIDKYKDRKNTEGNINKLARSINSQMDSDYIEYFLKKWLVGIISSINGKHSPLLFVLCGETQNTGKTEFFRRLLPQELREYYAESKLDAGKDDYILMTQKLIIMDDEMGGKSKKENKLLKELTSKETFSLREPYGRSNVDLKRLAVLCGTSNDNALLSDPSGNRRIIPVKVEQVMDFNLYNSINKIDLFIEANNLYNSGFNSDLTHDDIIKLNENTVDFEQENIERELLLKYFEPAPESSSEIITVELTFTEIKDYIEDKTKQRLSIYRLGQELKINGFISKHKKICRSTCRIYRVLHKDIGVKSIGLKDVA
jgi:hypothetical protein